MQRDAGHESLDTTQIYIREAASLGVDAGDPFPALPASVIGWPDSGPALAHDNGNYMIDNNKPASPAGFEPAGVGNSLGETAVLNQIGPRIV